MKPLYYKLYSTIKQRFSLTVNAGQVMVSKPFYSKATSEKAQESEQV